MAGHTSYMARASRGVRRGTPVELSDDEAIWKCGPALAAGNTMVLKPSDTTPVTPFSSPRSQPRSCRRACSTWSRGDRDTGRALVAHPIPRHGLDHRQRAGGHGGSRRRRRRSQAGPPGARRQGPGDGLRRRRPRAKAAEGIAGAGYFNAGQDCTAATRVLAGPSVYDEFLGGPCRTGQRADGRRAPKRRRRLRTAQQRGAARPGERVPGPRCPAHAGSSPAGDRSVSVATSSRRRSWPGAPGRRDRPEGGVRAGNHRPAVLRRGTRRSGGRTACSTACASSVWTRDHGRAMRMAKRSTSVASGSTPTSSWWPRCRTGASSTRATARTCRCTASRSTARQARDEQHRGLNEQDRRWTTVIVGVPKEVKEDEYRVAITPAGVRELTSHGHAVWVEKGAGEGSSIADEQFVADGSHDHGRPRRGSRSTADLVLGVKEPVAGVPAARPSPGPGPLHLPPPGRLPAVHRRPARRGQHRHRLRDGAPARWLAAPAHADERGGRADGAVHGGPPPHAARPGAGARSSAGCLGSSAAKVVILGAGVAGMAAATLAVGMHANVFILDRNLERLRQVDHHFRGALETVASSDPRHRGGLRRRRPRHRGGARGRGPGAQARLLTTWWPGCRWARCWWALGGPGRLLRVDPATAAWGRSYAVNGSICSCVANMPGAVPHSSTHALVNATLPYTLAGRRAGMAGRRWGRRSGPGPRRQRGRGARWSAGRWPRRTACPTPRSPPCSERPSRPLRCPRMPDEPLTLMAVHAHPDDEGSTTGGVLARYADEGVRTVLVTCTNGELGDGPGGPSPESPATTRPRWWAAPQGARGELPGAGRRAPRAPRLPRLGDDGLAQNEAPHAFWNTPVDEAAAELAELMDRYRPQVVVTYDENGFYGHPDHIQANRVTLAAPRPPGSPARVLHGHSALGHRRLRRDGTGHGGGVPRAGRRGPRVSAPPTSSSPRPSTARP